MKSCLFLNFDMSMHFKFVFTVIQPANFSYIHCDILNIAKGWYYKVWKEIILFHLGWMDIDYVIRKDKPLAVANTSTLEDITLYEWWERSNHLNMMFIKSTRISTGIRVSVDQYEKIHDLLKAIDD